MPLSRNRCGWLFALAVLSLCLSASPEALRVGYSECFQARVPISDFEQRHPEIALLPQAHARNAWGHPEDRPFYKSLASLPHVFPIHIGRFCSDLPYLADRGLIEPMDDRLEALGLNPDALPANVRNAVSYRGKVWAVPHHVLMDGLQMNRELAQALGIETPPSSWQQVFSLVASAVERGITTSFNTSGTMLELLECMNMSSGASAVDLADANAWASPSFEVALDLLRRANAAKQLTFRPANEPLRVSNTALFGLGRVESLHEIEPYVLIPFPRRLLEEDSPAEVTALPGMLEAYVLRANGEAVQREAMSYLKWLMSDETEWLILDATNQRGSDTPILLDSVHVPLREEVLDSLDFEYARKKFSAFAIMRSNVQSAWFSSTPAAIESVAIQRADEIIRRELDTLPASSWLPSLRQSVNMLVKATPAESTAYLAY